MLLRMEKIYNFGRSTKTKLLQVRNVHILKSILKQSAFSEFNDFWKVSDKGRFTFSILPEIGIFESISNVTTTRYNEKKYFTLSFAQNFLNEFQFKHGTHNKPQDQLCRFCKKEIENAAHVLSQCDNLNYEVLRRACKTYGLDFGYKILLVNINLKPYVESFIGTHFK